MSEADTPLVIVGDPDPFGRIPIEWNDFKLEIHMNWAAIKSM